MVQKTQRSQPLRPPNAVISLVTNRATKTHQTLHHGEIDEGMVSAFLKIYRMSDFIKKYLCKGLKHFRYPYLLKIRMGRLEIVRSLWDDAIIV